MIAKTNSKSVMIPTYDMIFLVGLSLGKRDFDLEFSPKKHHFIWSWHTLEYHNSPQDLEFSSKMTHSI